jgi:hypothetical protein
LDINGSSAIVLAGHLREGYAFMIPIPSSEK